MAVERGEIPTWLEEFARSFRAGESHAFLLHGDVDGTTLVGDVALRNRALLTAQLRQARDVVAVYRLGEGVEIVGADEPIDVAGERTTRRARALQLAGVEAQGGGPGAALGDFGTGGLAAVIGGLGPQAGGGDPFEEARRPGEALPLLSALLRAGERVAVAIDYADCICPAPAMAGKGGMAIEERRILVNLLVWAQDAAIGKLGNPIFLVCRDLAELHPDLRAADSGWKAIRIALPDRDARARYLAWFLAEREGRGKPIALDGLTIDEVANLTAGLSLRNIEDVLLVAYTSGGLTRALLKGHKDAIIAQSYSEVAQMLDPLPGGFADVGGREQIKDWLRRRVIAPLREGRVEDAAKGILFVGPPGTSKTYGARALARECGFNAVALNAQNVLGGIVGESERKMARFFAFAKALAPVLVFVDEIDQSDMGKRGDQSGNPVAANLFNQMLQFMGDEANRGQVLTLFASNRPDKLDPALIRSGRIDAIIPMLLPDERERRQIVLTQARLQGVGIAADAASEIAAESDKYSAADLAEIVREARLARARADEPIALEEAVEALADVRPSGTEQARFFTLIAVRAVNRRSLLPKEYASLLDDRAGLEKEVRRGRAEFAELAGAGRAEREW